MPERREISILDSLSENWLKLPLAVMQDVGPAVQTLGAILRITNRETYVPASDIAARARLPVVTVRRHIQALHDGGWINDKGRQQTRRGWLRRTCTIVVTKKTLDALEPYGFLPWWASPSVRPWCARAVLSVWFSRLLSLIQPIQDAEYGAIATEIDDRKEDWIANGDDEDGDADDPAYHAEVRRRVADEVAEEIQGAIDNMGGDERFRFSLKWLSEQTGLDHKSITRAKRALNHHFHIVRWQGSQNVLGVPTTNDLLLPNWDFRVVVTPTSETHCRLSFLGGKKHG